LLSASGLPGPALDALRYHDLPVERLYQAHPLTRLLRLADDIAANGLDAELALLAARWLALPPGRLQPLCTEAEQTCREQFDGLVRDAAAPEALREMLSLPWLFPTAATAAVDTLWQRLRATLEVQQGFSRVLLFARSGQGDVLEAIASPLAEGFRLPLRPGQSLITEASLTHSVRDSFDHGAIPQSVADEQLARLLDRAGLFCLPFSAGVVVIGVAPEERQRCLSQVGHLQRVLAVVDRALSPAPQATPPLPTRVADADRRLREARHELAAPLTTLSN
jgi:hypothetical protein